MTIKTLIFDFDGLILETEYPIYRAIRDIYRKYGTDLKLEDYTYCVGSTEDSNHFLHLLEKEINQQLDVKKISEEIYLDMTEDINSAAAIPGVENMLKQAQALNLTCVVASSSDYPWVHTHLKRLGFVKYFSAICTRENVTQVKPSPELFQFALKEANAKPEEAIVFEDSITVLLRLPKPAYLALPFPIKLPEIWISQRPV